jgi:hypothetical protein
MINKLHSLRPFSSAPKFPLSLAVDVQREPDFLRCRFILSGSLGPLSLPAQGPAPKQRDELWRSTCFEVFFARPGETGYWELNISPCGDWNFYSFRDYRQGQESEARVESLASVAERKGSEAYSLEVTIPLAAILAPHPQAPLQLGVTAVIATTVGDLSYWALRHCGEKPDFHLRESFVLKFL